MEINERIINRIAEQSIVNAEKLKKLSKQRRNPAVDSFGKTTIAPITNGTARFQVNVSPDLCYWERFQFKLTINDGTLPNLQILFRDLASGHSLIDLGSYLMKQYPSIPKSGTIPSTNINQAYDLLVVGGDMFAEGNTRYDDNGNVTTDTKYLTGKQKYNELLGSGTKEIVIKSNSSATITFHEYVKYSHLNR